MGRQHQRNHALYRQFGMDIIIRFNFKYSSIFYKLDTVITRISHRTRYEKYKPFCANMILSNFYECCGRLDIIEKEFNEMDKSSDSETKINSITNFIEYIKLLNNVDVDELQKLVEEEKKMKELQKLAEEEVKIKAEEAKMKELQQQEVKKKPKRKRKCLFTIRKRSKKIKIE